MTGRRFPNKSTGYAKSLSDALAFQARIIQRLDLGQYVVHGDVRQYRPESLILPEYAPALGQPAKADDSIKVQDIQRVKHLGTVKITRDMLIDDTPPKYGRSASRTF